MISDATESPPPSQVRQRTGSKRSFLQIRRAGAGFLAHGDPVCFLGTELCTTRERREGIFAEWRWNGETLQVQNDRYGFYPLYYFTIPGEICVSSSIPVLLSRGAPRELDEDALSVFLRMGFFVGDDTPFRAIRRFPPGASFAWGRDSFTVDGRIPTRKLVSTGRREALQRFNELVAAAVQKRQPQNDNFVVPLSGGRDSRHLLLQLCALGYRPQCCITVRYFSPWPSADVDVAARLCSDLSLKHVVLEAGRSPVRVESRKNLLTDFATFEHGFIMPMLDYLHGRQSTIYEGVAGDILTMGFSATPQRSAWISSGRFEALAEDLLGNRDPLLAAYLTPFSYAQFGRERAIARLARELKRHAEAANPLASFFLFNRTRRVTAMSPYSLLDQVGTVHTPYLDNDVYDFMFSLPESMFADHGFHTEAINFAFPKFAHVPYASKNLPAGKNYRFFASYAAEIARLALRASGVHLLSRRFLWPRLIRAMIDPNYSTNMGWIGDTAVFLLQFEKLAQVPAAQAI